jgi:small subunit ribosomal protein S16
MVRIRLRRVGRKKQPSYRIIVTDKRSSRDGRYIEIIGFYNPRTRPDTLELKEDRALYWLSVGAQPSEAVERIFKKLGTMDRFTRLKQGEEIEKLIVEAEAAAEGREAVSPQTQFAPMSKEARAVLKAARAKELAEAVTEEAETEEQETEAAEAIEEEIAETEESEG